MTDKVIIAIAICVMVVFVIMAREAGSVGRARASVEMERVKACAAAGKQIHSILIYGPDGSKIQEMECK